MASIIRVYDPAANLGRLQDRSRLVCGDASLPFAAAVCIVVTTNPDAEPVY